METMNELYSVESWLNVLAWGLGIFLVGAALVVLGLILYRVTSTALGGRIWYTKPPEEEPPVSHPHHGGHHHGGHHQRPAAPPSYL